MANMGYSHAWNYDDSRPEWAAGFDLLREDVSAMAASGDLAFGTDRVTVLVGDDTIVVAPAEEETGQSLVLRRHTADPFIPPAIALPDGSSLWDSENAAFASCKTLQASHDTAVTAVLLRAQLRLGAAIDVTSDGTWDDWMPGVQAIVAVFGDAEAPAKPRLLEP